MRAAHLVVSLKSFTRFTSSSVRGKLADEPVVPARARERAMSVSMLHRRRGPSRGVSAMAWTRTSNRNLQPPRLPHERLQLLQQLRGRIELVHAALRVGNCAQLRHPALSFRNILDGESSSSYLHG